MTEPMIPTTRLLELLEPPRGPVRMVLDTDTYNEIDDQFALVYALLSPERLKVEAIYAAPFHNDRSSGPEDGMIKSQEEILRLLARLGRPSEGFVFEGSRSWLAGAHEPVQSSAAEDLISRAKADGEGPLYVVAIGAITNVASAILLAPEIRERIVVVWLGGHPASWHHTREFNLQQDVHASRVVFDSGVPLVRIPCINVTEHLRTTQAEMERYVKGHGSIGDYLFSIYSDYYTDHYARSKELWDIGPIAWLVNPDWVDSALMHSPILHDSLSFSHSPHRHLVREALGVRRDHILGDFFGKLERGSGEAR